MGYNDKDIPDGWEGVAMGPKEKIERLAQTPEDRVLLARVWERLSAGQRREIPAFSCFLSLCGSRSRCAASWGRRH